MDNRPTIKVELLVSGITAEIFTYYLRGERKEIEAVMFDSAQFEQDENGTPKLKSVDASYRTKMEDKAVMLALKGLTDKEGNQIEKTVKALDELPAEDFDLLQKSLPGGKVKKG